MQVGVLRLSLTEFELSDIKIRQQPLQFIS